jgi:hypothetical protein
MKTLHQLTQGTLSICLVLYILIVLYVASQKKNTIPAPITSTIDAPILNMDKSPTGIEGLKFVPVQYGSISKDHSTLPHIAEQGDLLLALVLQKPDEQYAINDNDGYWELVSRLGNYNTLYSVVDKSDVQVVYCVNCQSIKVIEFKPEVK